MVFGVHGSGGEIRVAGFVSVAKGLTDDAPSSGKYENRHPAGTHFDHAHAPYAHTAFVQS